MTTRSFFASGKVTKIAQVVVPPPPPINVAAAIAADMGNSEVPIYDNNGLAIQGSWARKAVIEQGYTPRGDAAGYWWRNKFISPTPPLQPAPPSYDKYIDSTPWAACSPWWVIFPGKAHNFSVSNTRIEIYDAKVFFLHAGNPVWTVIPLSDSVSWWAENMAWETNNAAQMGSAASVTRNGHHTYKLDSLGHAIHGTTTKFNMTDYGIVSANLSCVAMQFKSRLILDNINGVDDRASAQLLMQCGVDYYLNMATNVSDYAPYVNYNPACGSGRFGLISENERIHYFASINPPGNSGTQSGIPGTMAVATFNTNLPPVG